MPDTPINAPGAPANPPHTAREGTAISDYEPTEPAGSVPPVSDNDPHPSNEGHPYAGDPDPGTPLRYRDIAPNPAIHTGTPEPRPDNADHGPKFSPG